MAAGDFGSWIGVIERAIREGAESAVPCDGCTACCRSHQFVHVGPDEHDTLAHLPEELLFPAPGMPDGHRVLPYDEEGRCPMLAGDRCSIYEHRPRACRAYDCRIFTATGVVPADRQQAVAVRARRWQFTFASEEDRSERDACQRAASYLERHPDVWGQTPPGPVGVAAGAVRIHGLFTGVGERSGETGPAEPDPSEVGAQLARRRPGRRERTGAPGTPTGGPGSGESTWSGGIGVEHGPTIDVGLGDGQVGHHGDDQHPEEQ